MIIRTLTRQVRLVEQELHIISGARACSGVPFVQFLIFCVVFCLFVPLFRSLYSLFFFELRLLITPLVSFGHCIVCPSSSYDFWLPFWYLQTFLYQNQLRVRRFKDIVEGKNTNDSTNKNIDHTHNLRSKTKEGSVSSSPFILPIVYSSPSFIRSTLLLWKTWQNKRGGLSWGMTSLELDNLPVCYYLSASEIWPDKRRGGPDKRMAFDMRGLIRGWPLMWGAR